MSNDIAIVAFNGFVGFDGASVRLAAGEEWNLSDPRQRAFYDANRDKFVDPVPEPVRPSVSRLRASGRGARGSSDG